MNIPDYDKVQIPPAPNSIAKGSSLADLLDQRALGYLAQNLYLTDSRFPREAFFQQSLAGLTPEMALMDRGRYIARQLHAFLPGGEDNYRDNIQLLSASLTPVRSQDENSEEVAGLGGFFYLPHSFYIAQYGLDPKFNNGEDPFELSMAAQYQLTQRFTAEFCIREFLLADQQRTLSQLESWLNDDSHHVRRLCSEGTRPRLPWGKRLPDFGQQPDKLLTIFESLKNDASLYVRRSIANSLNDIAKEQPEWLCDLCERWLSEGASKELKWLIRHSLRYLAKQKHERALSIRVAAK